MNNEFTYIVHFGDTDAAGIVFYPNYYRWMDQATHNLFRANDLSIRSLQEEHNIITPLIEATCNFRQPLQYEDEVTLTSTIERVDNKVFYVTHRFTKNGTLIAEGKETRAWVQKLEGAAPKAVEIPDNIKAKMKG